MDEYDVIVVGARVAGAPTAMLLAQAGARVLLLDRGRAGSDTVSTHALMRGGVLQLSRWGLLDRIIAAGTPPVSDVSIHCAGQDPVQVRVRPSPGVDALYAPRRHLLDGILVDAAANAGVDVVHEAAVVDLLRDRDERVRGVSTVNSAEHHAAYVVGADGIASTVAGLTDAELTMVAPSSSGVRYAYFEGLDDRGYEWYYGDHAACGIIPTNNGQHCVFVATASESMRAVRRGGSDDDVFATLLRAAASDHAPRQLGSRRVAPWSGWGGRAGFLRQAWGPGWALVGDAGYFKDPIASHGITDAFRDAELLAHALLDALGGRRDDDALDEYQRRRDALARPLLHVVDEVASYAWTGSEIGAALRRMSVAMSDEVGLLESLPLPSDRQPAMVPASTW
ncbi:NAD(P)/FAD-dependent oxidoreductase [Agromyces humatus]|uniref:NAD(P)/FAD-dependent oxidoreductase n=1 Tax=Agromyces humatus TaxID=279573 RepID=A0ABP4X6J0_9MICO|nr:NAD(P)/FAD-dependent oxidoreductase [Agromyces humatus]